MLLLSSTALVAAGPALAQNALPTTGSVVSGSATISSPSASSLLITQSSSNAIINWGSFSIGAGNTVRFENGTGATLNRVTGFSASQIDGSLSASGSLYLVNPNGITVGPGGTVTTGGSFVASTHDISDAEFNAGGAMTFKGSSAASVINYGAIGSLGGDVALIARKVENAGTITAPNGTVALAAGYEVLMRDAALSDGKFVVKVGGADTEAKTSGVIKAAEVELKANGGNVYALAGNTDSITKATGVATRGGRIFLTAGDGGSVTVSQKMSARAAASAGKSKGGEIRVSGGAVKVAGKLDAAGEGDAGGTIVVTGKDIQLAAGADLDASGTTGGVVLVGGDYQGGKNAATKYLAEEVATAQTVTVDAGAVISVDGTAGAGGRAVVWSDVTTSFNGTITAAGAGSGDGGQVETSGHALSLGPDLFVSTLSEHGATGMWLIDPYNVVISSGGSTNAVINVSGSPWTVSPTASGATINATTLSTYLGSSNVTVQTNGAGAEAGNIAVVAAVTWNANTTLTLRADATTGGIIIDAPITGSSAASSLVLSAGSGGIYQTAAISVGTLTATATNGGSVYLTSSNNHVASLGASSAAGSFAFTDSRALTVSGAVTSNGLLSLATTSGDLTINAVLSDSHAASSLTLTAADNLVIAKDIAQSGANASVSLSFGTGYALTGGARLSLPDAGATLTINGQAYMLIHDIAALQGIGTTGFYALANDIDASATAGWNGGAGFVPIGTLASPFSGTLAGLGHFADGLTVNRSTGIVGLFGATDGATLRDFTLSNVAITGGGARVGGVVGDAHNSTLSNLHVTGSVTAYQEAGGIAGWLGESTLSNASSAATVTTSQDTAGGLVGYAYYSAVISDSYATGAVSGVSDVGGLIGRVSDMTPLTLSNVYASGKVSGSTNAGALIGEVKDSDVTLTNTYFDSQSSGQSSAFGVMSGAIAVTGSPIDIASAPRTQSSYGGFDFTSTWVLIDGETRPMLRSEYSTVIATPAALQLMTLDPSASYTLGANINMASALAVGSNGYYGGLWGAAGFVPVGSNGTPFTGSFDGQGHTITGLTISRGSTNYVGLFGYTVGATIGDVILSGGSITGGDGVGALIGYMLGGSVAAASASATVSGTSTGEANTGGLIGTVDGGTVSDAYASGNVTGAGYQVGGLVGFLVNGGAITRSYATGNVTGTSSTPGNGYIGGLVGANGYSGDGGTISQSYATGTVTGSAGPIGGFVGHNEGTISDSYATGSVIGLGSSSNVGGFVGVNFLNGTISSSYSTGYVTGASSVGGFAGYNNNAASAITSAYWDTQTSGRTVGVAGGSGGGVTARATAQLQGSLPSGFSSSIWGTGTNLYPYLIWRYPTTPVAVSGVAYSDAGTTTLSGATVTAVSGGSAMGSATSGANGYYYILAPSSALASTGVLTYLDNGAQRGAAFSDVINSTGVQNVSLYANAAHVITGETGLLATQAKYGAARGSYADTDLSFLSAVSFAPLTLTSGYGVYINASAGSYALDGNLGSAGSLTLTSGGNFTVAGSRSITAANDLSITNAVSWAGTSVFSATATGGGISFGGAVSATAGRLDIAASGAVTTSSSIDVGTFHLASGTWSQVAAALPTFAAGNFILSTSATFLRATGGDGTAATPYRITDVYGLQGIASTSLLAQHFALVSDIDASGTSGWNAGAGFLSIGDATTAFTGGLAGGGYAITGLLVNRPTISAGLFGTIGIGGAVSNLSVSGSVTGLNAGLVAGANAGAISSVFTSGSVDHTGASSAGSLGGVAGSNSGTVTGSASGATVSAADASAVGGLVGSNSGTVSGSYAAGAVNAGSSGRGGGLVGSNAALISNSYATGNVGGGSTAGGLVGHNTASGTVSDSYSTGTVASAAAPYGGLIGTNGGTVIASFWDTTTSGTSLGVGIGSATGVTGLTTAAMSSLSTFTSAGWSIDDEGGTAAVWRIYDGYTLPLLRGFLTALTVTGGNGIKTYDGSTTTANVGTLTYGPSSYTAALVLGTAGYTASSANTGGYSGANLRLSGLYSSQLGYDITFASGSLTINPAALTVTGNDQSMTAGSAVPALTYTISGGTLYGSDTLTGALATTASPASTAGSYAITQGTLAASANYVLSYLPGTLTVISSTQPPLPVFVETRPVDQLTEASRTRILVSSIGEAGPNRDRSVPDKCGGATPGARCGLLPVPTNLPTGPWLGFRSR